MAPATACCRRHGIADKELRTPSDFWLLRSIAKRVNTLVESIAVRIGATARPIREVGATAAARHLGDLLRRKSVDPEASIDASVSSRPERFNQF